MNTIRPCTILLPKDADFNKWAVVACDQFTSERDYWLKLKDYVGDNPSTLNLIFPEVYLEDKDADERIKTINSTMQKYLNEGIFKEYENCCILIKRDTLNGESRLGLVCSVDLEDYCFTHPSKAFIRSTENVVESRIPPRLKIREDAPIELPHILLLIDDIQELVIESLYKKKEELEIVYDFDLNMGGGHLTGYRVDGDEVVKLFNDYEETIQTLYGNETNEFVFAVGDGNHSLATAQAHWNKIKAGLTGDEIKNHPARFALCEIENLHDEGIKFEPIHRFVFNVGEEFINYLDNTLSGGDKIELYFNGKEYDVNVDNNSAKAIKDIQEAIDKYLSINKKASVDYIHGLDHLLSVAKENEGVAIAMPKIKKSELFSYVLENGTLARKSFSMGEAEEKRYYVEAKKIK